MSAPGEEQVNLNYPDQDKKFQAYPAHDLQSQKSFSSDRVAPVKELEELVDRTIGCSGGMVKDQPSLLYEPTVDSELPLKLQTREYHALSTHEIGSSNFLQLVNLVPELLNLPDTAKISPSSQEASKSSQGLQQASTVPGHSEGTLPQYAAVYVKPNKDQKYVPTYAVGFTDSDEGQDSHEKEVMKTYLEGQLLVHGDMEPLINLWIREGKKSIPSTFMLAGELYHSLVCARAQAKYNVVEELLRRKKQIGDYDRESRKTDLKGYPPNETGDNDRESRKTDLKGYLPSERMLASLKARITEELQNLKMQLDYCHTHVSTNYSCEDQSRVVNPDRCLGLLQLVKQIHDKERSNKSIIDIIDFTLVKTLVDKSNQLTETYFAKKPDSLAVDRRYKKAYAAVREYFGNIRRNVEQWRDAVLHSVVPWFKEGAYNSNVRKLMNRGLARFGKGGNGELVEAFQSGERLVIKQTLLRESEWSIVTQMDHPNVMPWLALICGDRSDTKPGQIVSYQVMPKMTEDLSAAIRKMGGSIHHYILQLQEAEELNSVLSAKADLVRQKSAEILRGTLQGLDYMHRQNLVHRDIKASNILLKRPVDCPHEAVHTCTCQERWEVRVADFDSVIHLSVARDRAQRRKQLKVGNTGTSGYRAPEVFFESCTSDIDAKDYYSPASDIWSFGAVCLHLAMGFCCPRHQYQVGLIMLSRHNLVNIPAEEAQEKVDRTVGMYHIRQGFTGEKWQNMINFTARPLEVDWSKRPSAETLLKDPFVKPATNLNSSQTVTTTKDDKNVQRHQELSLDRNESSR